MSDALPIPPELDALIGRKVVSWAGTTGYVRDVAFYRLPAGDAHGAQWYVTVVNDFGVPQHCDLSTFNAIWTVIS